MGRVDATYKLADRLADKSSFAPGHYFTALGKVSLVDPGNDRRIQYATSGIVAPEGNLHSVRLCKFSFFILKKNYQWR